MTDHETMTHKRRINAGRWSYRFIVFGVVGCLLGMGNLYVTQQHYQDCMARFLAEESQARQVRGVASSETTQALVDAFVAAQRVTGDKTPSAAETQAFRAAILAVPERAKTYDRAIAAKPYRDFDKVCG